MPVILQKGHSLNGKCLLKLLELLKEDPPENEELARTEEQVKTEDLSEEDARKAIFKMTGKKAEVLLKIAERDITSLQRLVHCCVLEANENGQPKIPLEHRPLEVVNDPIHGHIELHPLILKIIDTPQFQRLRYIHQLGGAYYVFPGASHKRFEHSIGTHHLAGKLVNTLRTNQGDLGINDEDVFCVMIAGLCHDLGHGPFSHLFDPKVLDESLEQRWEHEEGSLAMFDYMVEKNQNLKEELAKYKLYDLKENLKDQKHMNFIKALIHSQPGSQEREETETGREREKNFLYEIVANKRNGIDVDKWDYFGRDAYSVGISNNFDHKRLMKFARVLEVEGERQICWRDKECTSLSDMFYTRFLLHRRVYQHKTVKAVEMMIKDALKAAHDHISLSKSNGETCKMSEAVHDMSAYMKLTDHIYNQILCSTDVNLSAARQILERIERRDIYRIVGETKDEDIVKRAREEDFRILGIESEDDVDIQIVTLNYGMKDKNPIDHVRFYSKSQPNRPVKRKLDEVPNIKPERFQERSFRILNKKSLKPDV